MVFFVLLVVLVIGLTAVGVLGRFGGSMSEPTSSQRFAGLPDGPLGRADVAGLRFDQALRGYRMGQVDQVVERLADQLKDCEAELAALRAGGGTGGGGTGADAGDHTNGG